MLRQQCFCPVKNPDRPGAKLQQLLLLGWLCHKRLVHFSKELLFVSPQPLHQPCGGEAVLPVTAAVPRQLLPLHPPCSQTPSLQTGEQVRQGSHGVPADLNLPNSQPAGWSMGALCQGFSSVPNSSPADMSRK